MLNGRKYLVMKWCNVLIFSKIVHHIIWTVEATAGRSLIVQ